MSGFTQINDFLRVKKYYTQEEDLAMQVQCLSKSADSLLKGHQFSSILRADVTFASNKLKELETSSKSLIEMVSWLDEWIVTVWSLANLR